MMNVVIVDDHPIVREGFKKLIDGEDDFNVVGTAETAADAVDIITSTKPDIAMVDLSLKESSGIELIKDLVVICPDVRILVVSLHDEDIYAERVLRAGAKGFIMKAEAVDDIITAVRKVAAGEIYLSPGMQSKMIEIMTSGRKNTNLNPINILSDRELEVFQLIGQGVKTKNIAEQLKLSVKTIETYKSHLKLKLQLKDGIELIQRAIEWEMKQNVR
ncbi:MAG: response regulator transcription factor [Spirochaetales bacterium]|uniref:Response regulator transcription factor n=1 Tax=Candidatus Thalassospirochaeta sargassi TaxID=3119039 RepID=A0AAJ1IFJ2_9SPIO|nr:response regulator transcription factor [Spirochaetales bacterium]